jgi:quercetin dioxygenase-like cupin family protein
MSDTATYDSVAGLEPYAIWRGATARAIHGDRLTMAIIDLEADLEVPEHHHDNEQLGFVIRGEMEMKIGEETRLLRPGDTYVIPSETLHSVVRTGPEGCVVADIFAPVRADWEAVERAEPAPGSWP